jgi:hypothetical protein
MWTRLDPVEAAGHRADHYARQAQVPDSGTAFGLDYLNVQLSHLHDERVLRAEGLAAQFAQINLDIMV